MLPISIVEFEGFRELLKLLVPLYKIPSRKTITRKLESRYDVLKKDFIKELENVPHYCITADNWTDCSNQSYMGFTIHYLTASLKMKSRFLSCFPLYDRHTAENLKASMEKVFEEFKIDSTKVTAMITDGEAAIKKACYNLVGSDKHIVCIAHVVAHLLPQSLNDFTALTTIIDRVKSIVTLIKRSIPASDKLKELQIQDGKSEGSALKLKQDVPTRWTTKIDMLERYIELESYIYVAMGECDNPIDLPNREEMKILKDVLPLMEPIRTVITEISGDSYPTSSLIIPMISCMEKKLESIQPKTEVGHEFKYRLQTTMANRFKDIEGNKILSASTILDPRYKKIHFKDPTAMSKSLTRIRKRIEETRLKKGEKSTPSNKELVGKKSVSSSNSIWEFYDAMIESTQSEFRSTVYGNESNESFELNQYLKLPLIDRKENIFSYWKSIETGFPTLSKLAIEQLSIIGTSVPSERVFSKAGNTKRDRRNRLTGKHLNILLFLSSFAHDDWFKI